MVLSVIIVNYNVKHFLEQCLCSVQKGISGIDAEIIVIDNNSQDGSVEYLQLLFPSVIFLTNEKNLGFGKANNIALQQAKGKFILFLNPDTIVAEDCFTHCITFLENTENAGAAGVRMIDGSGNFLPESKRSFPSPLSSFYKLIGLASLFPSSKIFNRYALGNLDQHQMQEIDVLAGAFMMIKKEVLEKVKGFDESFFMYGEDIDLSYRIQQAGYSIYYLGETTIIHFKGESVKKQNINYVRMFYNAMNVFVGKHYNRIASFIFSVFIKAAIGIRTIVALLAPLFHFVSSFQNKNEKTFIIGSVAEQQEVSLILQKAGFENKNLIMPENNNILSIERSNARKVIFCEGSLKYSEIISLMQSVPSASFRFHAAGSKSIVGSDSKKGFGETIGN
ncbi:MAG: glycosyltransferase family 2 protein [Bacteroidota bacterium]|nr:glycosyltransferase family 2 protein [Bacteroidota bacterium]